MNQLSAESQKFLQNLAKKITAQLQIYAYQSYWEGDVYAAILAQFQEPYYLNLIKEVDPNAEFPQSDIEEFALSFSTSLAVKQYLERNRF